VIASRIAGIPEALDDGRCGVLVPPGNVTALADAVERLLRDPALRHELARQARRRTEQQFDMWRNGARLAEHLGATRRLAPASAPRLAHSLSRRGLVISFSGLDGAAIHADAGSRASSSGSTIR